MEDIDFKLRLLGGRPIHAKGYGDVIPLKIRDIIDLGYSEYVRYLNILTLDISDFLSGEQEEDVSVLDLMLAFGGEEVESVLSEALGVFLGGEAIVDKDNLRIFIKKGEEVSVVDNSNFDEIQEVIKWQNYIKSYEEKNLDGFNPADEETKKLKEQMDAVARKRDEIKRRKSKESEDDSTDIDFYDIVSAISSKSYGINELNVVDLTVYQVYRKFKRLEIIEQYDISIKSILAGAKEVKLKHWSSKA